jgi:hypothetical protein
MPVTVERDGECIVIRVPMILKKVCGRKEVIVPEGLPSCPPPKPATQVSLVTAVARAHRWQDLLESGRFVSIAALAKTLRLDRCYLRRILNLACLAPDIVEAIIDGREPGGLSLERLSKGLPMAWDEQRTLLGFQSEPDRRRR